MPADNYKFQPGDEVCQIYKGKLIFGTVERQGYGGNSTRGSGSLAQNLTQNSPNNVYYTVKWNTTILDLSPSPGISPIVEEQKIYLTDRTLIKGMKVKATGDELGGQVGTVSDVMIRGTFRILGTGTVMRDMDISSFRHLKQFKQKSVVYKDGWLGVVMDVTRLALVRYGDGREEKLNLSNIYNNGPLSLESPWTNETKIDMSIPIPCYDFDTATFIKDLELESLTVRWVYNVDLNFPDAPPQLIKEDKIKNLKLITESSTIDDTYRLGDLGRFSITSSNSCDWMSLKAFSTKFISENGIQDRSGDNANNNLPLPEIVYNAKCYLSAKQAEDTVLGSGDSKSLVVEILHLSTIGNIFWQAGTIDLKPSTSLNVLSKNLSLNVRSIGDYVYSERFNYDPKLCFGVIQKIDLANKQLTIKVYSCQSRCSLIIPNVILPESDVVPHPRYQFFNDGNAIVTNNEGERLKIGHVQGNNLVGKLRVRWSDSKPGQEEWCSPTTCSLYILRGFDLDCIISQTNDEDEIVLETADFKLQTALMAIEEAYRKCLSLIDTDGGVGQVTLKELIDTIRRLYLLCLNLEENYSDERGQHFAESKKLMESDNEFADASANIRFVQTICETLINETQKLMNYLKGNKDTPLQLPTNIQYSIFRESFDYVDEAPSDHKYAAQKTEQSNLIKIVSKEYRNIKELKAPGIKTLAFNNRLDLFSAGISGPEETVYENGLYLFDGYLPPTFPSVPPKVLFLTFNSGRLNPNLYDCGKVCLSLLGTWAGSSTEQWTKESNLHQVLLSIQALILVKEPYHNEPGCGEPTDPKLDSHRHEYNTALAPKICNMIIGQLKYPPGIWKADIHEFYMVNLPLFITRWRNWIEIGEKHTTDIQKIKNALTTDYPGFTIYPMSQEFITTMTGRLENLDQELVKLRAEVEKDHQQPQPEQMETD